MTDARAILKEWAEAARNCAADAPYVTAAGNLSLVLAHVDALEKALEPFAKYIDGGMELDSNGAPLPDDRAIGWAYLTYGDLRRARKLIGDRRP